MPDSFLQTTTHRPPEWWVATIQQLVADASTPSEDPGHDSTDAAAWLKRLVDLVVDGLPVGGQGLAVPRHDAHPRFLLLPGLGLGSLLRG